MGSGRSGSEANRSEDLPIPRGPRRAFGRSHGRETRVGAVGREGCCGGHSVSVARVPGGAVPLGRGGGVGIA